MGRLLRQHFWLADLVLVAVGALLVARLTGQLVAMRLHEAPVVEVAPAAPAKPSDRTALDGEALGRVLGVEKPSEPVLPPVAIKAEVKDPGLARLPLPLRLIGTLIDEEGLASLATVEDVSLHTTRVLAVGDVVQGARVKRIERLRVLLAHDGRTEYIDHEAGAVLPPVAGRTAEVRAPQAAPTGIPGLEQTGPDSFRISRGDFEKQLGGMEQIAAGHRVVPAFENGKAVGFKVFGMRPDALFARLGLQNGDVVKRVNGIEIASPEQALEAYAKLRQSPRIEIELARGGQTVRKVLQVQ